MSMAPWPQPEDLMMQALLDVLEGRRPRNTEHHRYYSAPPPPGGGDPNRRGVSHNHWTLAIAVGLGAGDTGALPPLLRSLTPEHDFHVNEPYPRDEYCAFTLLAQAAQARFLTSGPRAVCDASLALEVFEQVQQDLAALLVASTDPEGVMSKGSRRTANWIVQAGPRAAPTKPDAGARLRRFREYILLRAAGWSDAQIKSRATDGARIVARAWRPAENWEDASIGLFVELLEPELRAAFAPIASRFALAGLQSLRKFFVRGTRVPFEWWRSSEGVVSIMAKNCNGNKGPLAAAIWRTNWSAPETFPPWAPVSGFEDTRAEIHPAKVTAWTESAGAWAAPLPGGAVELHWRSDSTGVRSLLPDAEPEPIPPTAPTPPAEPEPESDNEPEKDKRDRAGLVLACLAGTILLAALAAAWGCW